MKSFCIVTNKLKDPGLKFTAKVKKSLEKLGAEVTTDVKGSYECMIVLGGDGTIIDAVREANKRSVTAVGINLGHLGFLSSVEKAEAEKALKALVEDDFDLETRFMIEAQTKYGKFVALNDIVINRMGFSGMITTDVKVNDSLVSSYFADGVIISTPTGSTGYNLSAGGPIVTPEAQLMVITPICPHSLNMRSVVVSASDKIDIRMDLARNGNSVILSIDGRQEAELHHDDRLLIKCSARRVKLVRFKDKDFFRLLYMKLGEER